MELDRYLPIYLNDHRAGAAAGTELAERLWRRNRSGPWSTQLQDVLEALQAEKKTLDAVRIAVGVDGGDFRRAAALVAERISRLKPNGHFLSYSPLSRVDELEALMAGVQTKLRLWIFLDRAKPSLPALDNFDFGPLQAQSHEELTTLGEIHEWAVRQCLVIGSNPRESKPQPGV